jgi:hypothetical protein
MEKYKSLRIEQKEFTLEDICKPKTFSLQNQQKFNAKFSSSNGDMKEGLLVFHGLGSGKTCTGIAISEAQRGTGRKVRIVLPKSLEENFRKELRTECAEQVNKFLGEREDKEKKEINPKDFFGEDYLAICSLLSEDGIWQIITDKIGHKRDIVEDGIDAYSKYLNKPNSARYPGHMFLHVLMNKEDFNMKDFYDFLYKKIENKKLIEIIKKYKSKSVKPLKKPIKDNYKYITPEQRSKLNKLKSDSAEYKKIINDVNKKIDEYYDIYSYQMFVKGLKNRTIDLDDSIVIVDEVQNIISKKKNSVLYETIKDSLYKAKNVKFVGLTGTPIFDNPIELGLLMNLIKRSSPFNLNDFKNGGKYVEKRNDGYYLRNAEDLQNRLYGYISYFKGAHEVSYPKVTINDVNCEFSDFQLDIYNKIMSEYKAKDATDVFASIPNAFYFNSRVASNFVYPNGKTGDAGLKSLKDSDVKGEKLKKYSSKTFNLIKKLKEHQKSFVFANFVEYGGVKEIVMALDNNGFSKYGEKNKNPKYATFTGKESHEDRNAYVRAFNDPKSDLFVIIGSPSMKEGVSLLRTRQVHIFDRYWNEPHDNQVIGRGVRFCSHADLPENERHVDVYFYNGTHKSLYYSSKGIIGLDGSVDEFLKKLSAEKDKLNSQFYSLLKSIAVDCPLFKHSNGVKTCFTPSPSYKEDVKEQAKHTESIKVVKDIKFRKGYHDRPLYPDSIKDIITYLDHMKKENDLEGVYIMAHITNEEQDEVLEDRAKYVKKLLKTKGFDIPILKDGYRKLNKSLVRIDIFKHPIKRDKPTGESEYKLKKARGEKKGVRGCPANRVPIEPGKCDPASDWKFVGKTPKGVECCYKKQQSKVKTPVKKKDKSISSSSRSSSESSSSSSSPKTVKKPLKKDIKKTPTSKNTPTSKQSFKNKLSFNKEKGVVKIDGKVCMSHLKGTIENACKAVGLESEGTKPILCKRLNDWANKKIKK